MNEASFNIKYAPIESCKIIGAKDFDFAKVVAFDEEGRILTLITADGLSLPCDRLDMDDRDAFDTALPFAHPRRGHSRRHYPHGGVFYMAHPSAQAWVLGHETPLTLRLNS